MQIHFILPFQHRAGLRPNTSLLNFAESCVFDKQSLSPSLCHFFFMFNKKKALVLPKLLSYFAEFL